MGRRKGPETLMIRVTRKNRDALYLIGLRHGHKTLNETIDMLLNTAPQQSRYLEVDPR